MDSFHINSYRVRVMTLAEAYSESSQISKMESFAQIANCKTPLISFAKHSFLHVWQGASD